MLLSNSYEAIIIIVVSHRVVILPLIDDYESVLQLIPKKESVFWRIITTILSYFVKKSSQSYIGKISNLYSSSLTSEPH